MKTNLRTAVLIPLAASLGLALPTWAEPVKPKAALPPMLDATVSLLREVQQANTPSLPLRTAFERFEAFRPTPATADKLRAAFGTEHPYLFARQPDKAGRPAWRATLLPLHVQSDTGTTVDWDAAVADFTLDKTGNGLDIDGRWPRLSVSGPNAHMTASGMTLTGHQQRGYGGVWYGGGRFDVASVRIDDAKGAPALEMSGLRSEMRTTEHPKTADIGYDVRIGALAAGGERIEDTHIGIRIVNLDKKALAAAKAASEKQQMQQQMQQAQGAPLTPEQRLAAMQPLLRAFGQSAIAYGTAVEIDDISARFHGNTASIHGRIALSGAHESELEDFKSLARHIVARLEIKVPLALVRDVAGIVAARQAAAQAAQGTPPNPQPDPQMGQTIADVIVGKLVGGGFAKVEDEALVSTLEWRDGALTANGKPVALPTAPATPAMSSSEVVSTNESTDMPAAPLPDNVLKPRLVDGSCRMPDYPDEVVRADKRLFLLVSYRIDAEGKVHDVAVPSHTAFPEWDQAVQDALAHCTYVPALRDGQPAELKMFWRIQRAPGSKSPQ